jgi:Na+/H+ antiporter NhaD/arsenite permease-like protein
MHQHQTPSERPVVATILAIASLYAVALLTGWLYPPKVETADSEPRQDLTHADGHEGNRESEAADRDGHDQPQGHSAAREPELVAVLPFVGLLAAIAVFPIWRKTAHWWESNWHRFQLTIGLSAVTFVYYFVFAPDGGWSRSLHVVEHALFHEYVPFIVLLFSLYTISGGIRITGDLEANPATNSAFLAIGGLLASFIGTTGAAMILIRPLLESNAERKRVQHTVVFFIFVVCNCGGCLLPTGDPPLFLGYLRGVPFLWTFQNLWHPWLIVNTLLILVYYLLDRFWFHPLEAFKDVDRDERTIRPIRIEGLNPNAWLLVGVVLSVALLDPSKPIPGTDWKPWPYLREISQLSWVAVSLITGARQVRVDNRFNYHAIVEVAALFVGIFICMQPALEILAVRGASLGIDSVHEFFWYTGSLSSVLDNAPTYVVFYESAASNPQFQGQPFHEIVMSSTETAHVANQYLIAISLGAVYMGAMTYIGNGPNFMVRAIAEQSGVPMPSFFGYTLKYALPVLVPLFVISNLIIF